MPNIQTTKSPIIATAQANVQLGARPGQVLVVADNEGVSHRIMMTPEEATQLGVAIIQLAAQAKAMEEQQRVQVAMPSALNGAIKLAKG